MCASPPSPLGTCNLPYKEALDQPSIRERPEMRGRSTVSFTAPHMALILPWIEQIVALSHSSPSAVTRPTVYDRVIADGEQRARLHEYSKSVGLEHRCFTRPLPDGGRSSNIIERTLDSILTQFERGLRRSGDGGDELAQHSVTQQQYVEYWTRQVRSPKIIDIA